jgi:hypothetical protein
MSIPGSTHVTRETLDDFSPALGDHPESFKVSRKEVLYDEGRFFVFVLMNGNGAPRQPTQSDSEEE